MVELELSGSRGEGVSTLLDEADYARFSEFRWYLSPLGYVMRTARSPKRVIYLHREVLGLVPGDGREADHINRNRLDNTRANLRSTTRRENAQNRCGMAGSSRYRGVHWCKRDRKWVARVKVDYKHRTVGYFDNEDEAGAAAAAYRAEVFAFSSD